MIPAASAAFVAQMEEVLDTDEKPCDPAHPVICLDETPQQLIGETRTPFTDSHGVIHADYEYERHGVADIYVVCEPLAGKRELFVTDNHTSQQWAKIVVHIAEKMYPDAAQITLIQDNLSAHKKAALYDILPPARARAIIQRLNIVFTPKHGSWLNVAEIELSVLKRVGLTKRVGSREELVRLVSAYEVAQNEKEKKIDWQFKTADARIKLKKLYPVI